MSSANKFSFMDFLDRLGQDDWWSAVNNLAPLIHEVDRDATKIWFYFWPLWVRNMLQDAEANPQLLEELEFKGVARLEQQIDSSHAFVYGHRYWPQVKMAISERASSQAAVESRDLVDEVRQRLSAPIREETPSRQRGSRTGAFERIAMTGRALGLVNQLRALRLRAGVNAV